MKFRKAISLLSSIKNKYIILENYLNAGTNGGNCASDGISSSRSLGFHNMEL